MDKGRLFLRKESTMSYALVRIHFENYRLLSEVRKEVIWVEVERKE